MDSFLPFKNLIFSINDPQISLNSKKIELAVSLGLKFYPKTRKGLSFILTKESTIKKTYDIPHLSLQDLEKGIEVPEAFASGFLRQADDSLQRFHATPREAMPQELPGFAMSLPLAFFPAIYLTLTEEKTPYYFEGAYAFQQGDTFYNAPTPPGQTWGASLKKITLGVQVMATSGTGQANSALTCQLLRPSLDRSRLITEPAFLTTQSALLRFAKTGKPADLQGGQHA